MADELYPVEDDLGMGATVRGFIEGQRLFNRYVLLGVLGRGGMGVVWKAHDEQLEREIALKFLPELITLDKEAISDLKRETRRSLELTHTHIVRIHDFVQDRMWAAISMEYVEGDTLSAYKVDQPNSHFEVDMLSGWTAHLCDALEYAHTKAKVVHRDLKPANLMINRVGDLKIADFGIARSVSDSVSRVTMRGGSSGTLAYMSPQQAQGRPQKVTDDVYAVGATLYDLLSGKPPFYSGNVQHQLESITPDPIKERRGQLGLAGEEVPAEWEQTVAACLEKNEAQRPQSMAEVAERLGLRAATVTVRSQEPAAEPAVASGGPPPPRKGWPVWGAIAAVIVVLLIGGIYLLSLRHSKPSATVASDQATTPVTDSTAAPSTPVSTPVPAPPPVAPSAPSVPVAGQAWTNSLGMKFVPAGTDSILFGVWDVRVEDFKAFVDATGYDATSGMYSVGKPGPILGDLGWDQRGDTWKSPGFTQTDDSPVVGVNWNDAHAFCDWLTKKEQAEGKLGPNQSYRLPNDAEWSKAVGLNESADGTPASKDGKITDVYPWGTQWPPPQGSGNFAGSEARDDKWPDDSKTIDGYTDGYPRTSPVGSFAANGYGLYDMGGDVFQWCEDKFDSGKDSRVLRGSGWNSSNPFFMISSSRSQSDPGDRYDFFGFRVIVVVSP